jgi:hypothetical protein
MSLPTAAAAARNNAEWCDTVCRVNGCTGRFAGDAWTTAQRPPPYYPDAVTLAPTATGDAILRRVDTSAGCSVKDSFTTVDLSSHGFRVLFGSEWIGRAADRAPGARTATPWRTVEDASELAEWGAAWADGPEVSSPFGPGLLDQPHVIVLAGHRRGAVVSGAILNRSATVIGCSNLFALDGDLDAAWEAAVIAATNWFPGAAIVGYESGAALVAARRRGFESLGPLRVWIKDGPEAVAE